MEEGLSKEEIREIKTIRGNTNEPANEKTRTQLIVNKISIKDKKTEELKSFNQVKVTIPKKFLNIIKIDKDTHQAEFTLNKKEKKITMEITKNG